MYIYCVYDTKDNYILIGVFDSAKEIANYFELNCKTLYSMISRKQRIKKRYVIEKVKIHETEI